MAVRAERRALVAAIGASLVLHALVLVPRPHVTSGGSSAASPIVARLAQAEEMTPASPIALSPREKPRPRAISRKPAVAAAEAAVPMPTASDEPSVDEATSVARFRYQLIGAALPYKRYPQEAIDAGLEGDVLVRVAIGVSGSAEVSVKASSGQPLLDQGALEAFRAAAPLVPPPAALRGQAFGVEVRAVYRLRD
jgi:periplasmic protein TonB